MNRPAASLRNPGADISFLKAPSCFSLLPPFQGKCCHFHLHARHSLQHVSHQQTKKNVTPPTETPQFQAAIIFHSCCSSHVTLLLQCAEPLLPLSLSTFSGAQVEKNEIIWISCVNTPLNFDSNTQIIAYCEKPNGIGCFPTTLCPERIIKAFILGVGEKHDAIPHRRSDHQLLLLRLLQFQPQAPSPPQCCLTPITSPGPRTITASCALTRERRRSPAGS